MKTTFLGQAYSARSPILASQTAINIFPELTETEGSDVGGFYGTPGLQSVYSGSGEVRGLWASPSGALGEYVLFAVIGNQVYRFDKNYNATNLGTLTSSYGRVSMVDNGTQLAIAHSGGWHWVSIGGSAIAPVSGAPQGGSIISALDNYVLFTENAGGEFGITALGDLSSIDPLDVATAEGWPDDCVSLIGDHREVWLFGTETIEIWSDTGAAFFPFERAPGGFIEQGCAAKFSPAKLDNSVFWLGRDRNGKAVAYRANAYIPLRISTHAMEANWGEYSDISDAIGYGYQEDGHTFYVLTFPTANKTWVYDVGLRMWHQRAYLDAYGVLNRHRSNCYAFFYGDHLVGDYANGKIYRQSLDLTTDDGNPIYRERAFEIADAGDPNINNSYRIDLLELVSQTGTQNTTAASQGFQPLAFQASPAFQVGGLGATQDLVWAQISRDNGQTWSYERYQSLGALGKFLNRVRWRRLGRARYPVLRVATTTSSPVAWVSAYVNGEALAL